MSTQFAAPRATWTVLRLIWMQILLSLAIIVEHGILRTDRLGDVFALTYDSIFTHARLWQLVTTTLIDLDPVSLLFNALMLWMFGSELEQRWGRAVFARFVLICALGSSSAFLALAAFFPEARFFPYITPMGPMLGLLLAYAIYWPDRQVWIMFLFPVRIKYLLLVIGLMQTVYAVSRSISPLVVGGHLGGLVASGLMLLVTGGEPHRLSRPFARLGEMLSAMTRKKPKPVPPQGSGNLEARIDEILDKISRGGMKSLSEAEKKFLRDASDRMNRTKH
ncbi:MAG: rhomboid family intramembrane serine protease [Leptospiraceae bacterium]|nr:rhomboid family intramembrane serine protease [Leptospiraceae bacterium]